MVGSLLMLVAILVLVFAYKEQNGVLTFELAKLYESEGLLERAADMYRALSRGSDTEHHATYHYEAGRLLRAAGLTEEARRMLMRADALASEDDASFKERIAQTLGASG